MKLLLIIVCISIFLAAYFIYRYAVSCDCKLQYVRTYDCVAVSVRAWVCVYIDCLDTSTGLSYIYLITYI